MVRHRPRSALTWSATSWAVTSAAWCGHERRPAPTARRKRRGHRRRRVRNRVDDHHRTGTRRARHRATGPTASRRSATSCARPSPRCTAASTTPVSSTPRRDLGWARIRPPWPPRARERSRRSSGPSCSIPWQAWEVAGSGELFAEPIPRLSIDRGPKPSQSTYPVWTASLRTGWVKHRAAQLQVSASPSFNVTVLELIPATPRRTGNRSFLRVGLPVIEELARRLEATRTQHCSEEGERWPHT